MNPETHIDRAMLLRTLFPNMSESCKAANAQNDHPQNTGKAPVVERDPCHESLEARQVQETADGRIHIHIESVRRRLADEDGLCEKFVVDCCRYAGWLPDDSPGLCKITTTQRKAKKGEPEETIIRITYP